jgi:uncharacterized membrane-anchored protein YhcB (DUF1043 family)
MKDRDVTLPKSLKEWVPYLLGVFALILIVCIAAAALLHINENQFIASDELKQEAKQLESYSAEAKLISEQTLKKSAPQSYTEVYSTELIETIKTSIEKLSTHAHASNLNGKVHKTIKLARELKKKLDTLSKEPVDQLDSNITRFFSRQADMFAEIDGSL